MKKKNVFQCVMEFKKRYPLTIMWRVKKHCDVIEKHLNPNEKVLYAFAGQKNDSTTYFFDTAVLCVTSERIMLAQNQILYGYTFSSITPEMYNDLMIYSGIFWGKIVIDTVKEIITFSNLEKKSLAEIETIISMYMMEAKKMYPNIDKVEKVSSKLK